MKDLIKLLNVLKRYTAWYFEETVSQPGLFLVTQLDHNVWSLYFRNYFVLMKGFYPEIGVHRYYFESSEDNECLFVKGKDTEHVVYPTGDDVSWS